MVFLGAERVSLACRCFKSSRSSVPEPGKRRSAQTIPDRQPKTQKGLTGDDVTAPRYLQGEKDRGAGTQKLTREVKIDRMARLKDSSEESPDIPMGMT
jgi:hypothetical protein